MRFWFLFVLSFIRHWPRPKPIGVVKRKLQNHVAVRVDKVNIFFSSDIVTLWALGIEILKNVFGFLKFNGVPVISH